MKKIFMLFTVLVVLFTTNAYSQKYAATQLITNSDGVSYNVSYLDEAAAPKGSSDITANVDVIWSKLETYAIGDNAYYSLATNKSFINWSLNDQRVALYGNTNTADWEYPTVADFTKAFANKAGSLFVVADGEEIYVLDASGNAVWQKTVVAGVSYGAPFPDGSGFYFSDGDFKVYSYLLSSPNNPAWTLQAETYIVGINVSEDHSALIVCMAQPATKALIVDPANGDVKQELYYYNNSPTETPAFSANGEFLALTDFSGKGTLYKRIDGDYVQQWQTSLQHSGSSSTWGCGIGISADGSTIAFGTLGFIPSGYMGSLYVFNNYSGVPIWSFHDFGDEVCSVSISDDGSLIAAATYGPSNNATPDLYVFRKESPEPIGTLSTQGAFNYVSLADDGSRGIAAGKAVHPREMGWGGHAYFFNPVPATFGNIAGVVTLGGSSDNSNVFIKLEGFDDYYDYSDASGNFDIKYIPAGTYSVTATKQGYYSKTIDNVVIIGNNTTTLSIELVPAGEPVMNLFATQGAELFVKLTWSEYEGTHIGFNIYRKLNPDAPFSEILATIGANTSEYIDNSTIPTKNYYYVITANISGELESPFSNTALGYTSTAFITRTIDAYSTSNIPTMDGVMSAGEWDDAFVLEASDFLGADGVPQEIGSVTLYFKCDNTHLYVAVINRNDTQLNTGDRTAFYIDDNYNGVYEPSGDDSEGNYWINYGPAGVYGVQYRPIYNTGGVGGVYDLFPNVGASDALGYVVAEFSLPIGTGDYDINPGTLNKSKIYLYARNTAGQDGEWPFDNPDTFNPIGYGTINFFVTDDVPPPPENLRYVPNYMNTPEFVAIAWDLPPINDLDYFNVTIKNVNSGVEDTFVAFGNQILYNVDDLTTYNVTVTTVDKTGNESVDSETLVISTNFTGIVIIDKKVFSVYPNPANNILNILSEKEENGTIQVYNISGSNIGNYTINGNRCSIDVSSFPNGLYFIKIGSSVQKFIKK